MKKTVILFAILLLSGSTLFAQIRINFDVISNKRPPTPAEAQAMRGEELAHPNITTAMHQVENSLALLNAAGQDFGGYKAQAITNLQNALWSLRKALYFRIYQDTH